MTILQALKAFIVWNWELDKPAHLRAHNQPRPQRAAPAVKQITHAVQRGSFISVYSGNSMLFGRSGDELMGYTGNSVSVRHGNFISVYDARGRSISTAAAR